MAEKSAGGIEVARLAVRVVPNLLDFRRDLKKGVQEAAKAASGETVEFDPEISEAETKAEAKGAAKAASGEVIEFESRLERSQVVQSAKRAAQEASGQKINFGMDIDRTGIKGLLNSLRKGFTTVDLTRTTGRLFDNLAVERVAAQTTKAIQNIQAGLAKVRRAGQLTTSALTKGINLFGRSVKAAVHPVIAVGKGLSGVARESKVLKAITSTIREVGRSFGDELRNKVNMASAAADRLRSRFTLLPKVVNKVRSAADRTGDAFRKMSDFAYGEYRAGLYRIADAFDDVRDAAKRFDRETIVPLQAGLANLGEASLDKLRKGFEGFKATGPGQQLEQGFLRARGEVANLRGAVKNLGTDFRNSSAGMQLDHVFQRVRGEAVNLRDRVREIGKSDKFQDLSRKAEVLGRKFRNMRMPKLNLMGNGGDNERAHAMVDRLTERFRRLGKSAGDSGNRIEHSSRKILGLTRVGWIVLAVFMLLAPAISLVGSLMAGLPTLLAAVGAAAAVIALGFDGIKDAVKPLASALEPLKATLSDVFRTELTPQFEKLAAVLPQLESGMVTIARGVSTWVTAMTDVVTMPANVQLLNGFLTKTGDLFRDMAPGIGLMTQGLLTMFDGAAAGFPAMAGQFNIFAARFNADMSRLVQTGQLQAAMDSMAVVFGSFFTNIHRILVAGIEQMPNMTEGLTGFFEGFGDLIVGAMPALASFSNMVGVVLGALGTQLGSILAAMGPGLTTTFEALTPILTGLLGAIGPALAGVLGTVADTLGVLAVSLGPAFTELTPVIASLAEALGGALSAALIALQPVLPELVTAFTAIALVVGESLTAAILAITPHIPMLVTGFVQIVTVVAQLATSIAEFVSANGDWLGPLAVGVLTAVGAFKTVGVIVSIIGKLKTVLAAASIAVRLFGAALMANPIGLIIGLVAGLVAGLVYFFTQTETGKRVWEKFKASLASAGQTLSELWTKVKEFCTQALDTIGEWCSNAADFVQELPGKMLSALGDLGAFLKNSGMALIQGFINGIMSKIEDAKAAASNVLQAVRDFFPFSPAKTGPFSGRGYTTHSGAALVNDFAAGMTGAKGAATGAVADILQGVQDNIEAVNQSFRNFNENIVLRPVLEANAGKIADFRKREAEELAKGNADLGKLAEERQKMLDSLESPDYRDMNLSFQSFYIEGAKGLLKGGLLKAVKDTNFTGQLRQATLTGIEQARQALGDHPLMAQVEANVNAEHFESTIMRVIDESGISQIPIELGIANLDQFKSDLGFGDGAISRAIDAAMNFNPNETDARRFEQEKSEVHYHVADMDEAIRLHNENKRREALRYN